MQVLLASTTKIVSLNGVQARIWEGHTAGGVRCHAFVTRIGVHEDQDQSEFERELQEHAKPSLDVQAIPLALLI